VNDMLALALILLLATSGYAAGRMHGQFGYRWGYRNGYRQGYFDGDRASWNRRRRDLQATVASVLMAVTDPEHRPEPGIGTTYTSASRSEDEPEGLGPDGRGPEGTRSENTNLVVPKARGRHARNDRGAVRDGDANRDNVASDTLVELSTEN
jgi:hypothetical protein